MIPTTTDILICYMAFGATVSDAYKAAYAAKKKHLAKALNRDVNSIINPSYQPIIDAMFAIRKRQQMVPDQAFLNKYIEQVIKLSKTQIEDTLDAVLVPAMSTSPFSWSKMTLIMHALSWIGCLLLRETSDMSKVGTVVTWWTVFSRYFKDKATGLCIDEWVIQNNCWSGIMIQSERQQAYLPIKYISVDALASCKLSEKYMPFQTIPGDH